MELHTCCLGSHLTMLEAGDRDEALARSSQFAVVLDAGELEVCTTTP